MSSPPEPMRADCPICETTLAVDDSLRDGDDFACPNCGNDLIVHRNRVAVVLIDPNAEEEWE